MGSGSSVKEGRTLGCLGATTALCFLLEECFLLLEKCLEDQPYEPLPWISFWIVCGGGGAIRISEEQSVPEEEGARHPEAFPFVALVGVLVGK